MSTRQPQDGDLVEVLLTEGQKPTWYNADEDERSPKLLRGRVYGKSRGLDFVVELFEKVGQWDNVHVKGADSIVAMDGERIKYLERDQLTPIEQLHFTLRDVNGGVYRNKLHTWEDRSDRYDRKGGEGVGWVWGKAELNDKAVQTTLTLYLDSYSADEAQLAVQVAQEHGSYPEYELTDTFQVTMLKRRYDHTWESGYRMDGFNRYELSPREAVEYAGQALETLHELAESVERGAEDRAKKHAKKVALDMLQPYLKAFFKEHGETPGV